MTKPEIECAKEMDDKIYKSEDRIEKKLDEIKLLLRENAHSTESLIEKAIKFTWKAFFIAMTATIGISGTAFAYLNNKVVDIEKEQIKQDKKLSSIIVRLKFREKEKPVK